MIPTNEKDPTAEEIAEMIDRETGKSIRNSAHPVCGADEQIGILREQIVAILNELGLFSTAEFSAWNQAAIAAITAGRAQKELLDA